MAAYEAFLGVILSPLDAFFSRGQLRRVKFKLRRVVIFSIFSTALLQNIICFSVKSWLEIQNVKQLQVDKDATLLRGP